MGDTDAGGRDPLADEQDHIDAEDAAARDRMTGAATTTERRENGEHLEPTGPSPLGGDVQLSLDVGKVLGRAARNVEAATISLSAAEVPVDGLFRPEQRYAFLAMGVPGQVLTVYVRDPKSTTVPKRVTGVKLRQNVTVDTVRRADDAGAIGELFGALLEQDPPAAAALLDRMQDLVGDRLKAAA